MEATISDSTTVTEPLLEQSPQEDKPKAYEPATWSVFWDKTRLNVISDFGSLLGKLFGYASGPQTVPINLSPVQEERLRLLRQRLNVPYDCSSVKHQDALKELWTLAYPNRQLPSLKSDLWKEMGWQNSDPATDFRAGGFMSLENLIYFAKNYPDSFQRLLHKTDGKRAEWEYPFAVAGVNISYMLVQMLDLQSGD
ncbi:hypothetical protein PR202_ga24903 [Eleusine coracana subsp. coracana]|uniref:ELMO domain-containing protein n=1 Tax=Eleusine coracana subsp. coracana TaxID=191504 RepID=A0AAV5DAV7_ELECO|nr:hypothetical protein PR202_ga24903 [Eleusine coracana subsp. coracana]